MTNIPPFVPPEPLPPFESKTDITSEKHVWEYKKIFHTRWQKTLPAVFFETMTLQETVQRLVAFLNEQMKTIEDALDSFLVEIQSYQTEINAAINSQNVHINQFSEQVSVFVNNLRTEVNRLMAEFEELQTDFDILRSEWNAFKTLINNQINEFENSMQNRFDDFTNQISKQQSDFENEIRDIQSAYETKINGQFDSFENEINTQITSFESEINGQITGFESEMNVKFNDLTTFVENWFANLDLRAEIKDIIDTKILTGEIGADVTAGTDGRLKNRKVVFIYNPNSTFGRWLENNYADYAYLFGDMIRVSTSHVISYNIYSDFSIDKTIKEWLDNGGSGAINRMTDLIVFCGYGEVNVSTTVADAVTLTTLLKEVKPDNLNMHIVNEFNFLKIFNWKTHEVFFQTLYDNLGDIRYATTASNMISSWAVYNKYNINILKSIWIPNMDAVASTTTYLVLSTINFIQESGNLWVGQMNGCKTIYAYNEGALNSGLVLSVNARPINIDGLTAYHFSDDIEWEGWVWPPNCVLSAPCRLRGLIERYPNQTTNMPAMALFKLEESSSGKSWVSVTFYSMTTKNERLQGGPGIETGKISVQLNETVPAYMFC